MLPALAFFFAVGQAIEARRDALLSFDVEAARRIFPSLKLVPVAKEDREWTRRTVSAALARYPAASLVARLDRVYAVDEIAYDGMEYAGLNRPKQRCVMVALTPKRASFVQSTIHHEFSHILMERSGRDFPIKAWLAADAPGFRYGVGDYGTVKSNPTSLAFDPGWAAQGALSAYGGSSLSEDWATVAESVLQDDPDFWDLASRFPLLRTKAQIVGDFYREAFPGIRLRDVRP